MTRKSKRELERAVEVLDGRDDQLPEMILYEDPETGEFRTSEGDVVPPEETAPLVIIGTEVPQ